jgi:predicted MFS family arabinose efflux permease
VVAGALAFADSTGLILGLTVLLGVVFAIGQPAEFALVPALAGERVQEANGHVETARYVGFAVGPIAGGALVATGGTEIAMLVDAGTFALVTIAALSLRVRRPPRSEQEPGEGRGAMDGIRFLLADRL